jgi:hypothetical protein
MCWVLEANSLHMLAVAVWAVQCLGARGARDIDSVPRMDTGRGPYDTPVHVYNLNNPHPKCKIENIREQTIM